MQGIFTHIPETNYVPREYSVAAILLFLFMLLISLVSVLNLLCFYISTFQSMCAVPNMDVFCSSLTSWFPGMLLTYFLNVFEIAPVAPIITGITFVFTFHMRCISIVRSLDLLSSSSPSSSTPLSLSSYRATLKSSVFENLSYSSINSELTYMKSHMTLRKYVECIFLLTYSMVQSPS